MKKIVLSQWFAALLLLSGLVGWSSVGIRGAVAMDKSLSAPAPSNDPTAIAAINQVSRDMGDAMVAGDVQKLNQIYADDWTEIGSSGEVDTRKSFSATRPFMTNSSRFSWGFAQVARDFWIYVIGVVDSCCLENEERESQASHARSTEHLCLC